MRAFFITLTTTPQKQKSNERYQPSGDEHKYIEGIKGVGGGWGRVPFHVQIYKPIFHASLISPLNQEGAKN